MSKFQFQLCQFSVAKFQATQMQYSKLQISSKLRLVPPCLAIKPRPPRETTTIHHQPPVRKRVGENSARRWFGGKKGNKKKEGRQTAIGSPAVNPHLNFHVNPWFVSKIPVSWEVLGLLSNGYGQVWPDEITPYDINPGCIQGRKDSEDHLQ